MKKVPLFLLSAAITLTFCACGGNVNNVAVKDVGSEVYSSDEIDSAIETIVTEFDREWKSCTLKEIYYAGDERSAAYQDWADRNDADEVIVLLSTFDVGPSGGEGGVFNSNSTYSDWMWILVRDNGGEWKHVDHGY